MNPHLFTVKFAVWTCRLSLAIGFINNKKSKDSLSFFFKYFRHASFYVTGVSPERLSASSVFIGRLGKLHITLYFQSFVSQSKPDSQDCLKIKKNYT